MTILRDCLCRSTPHELDVESRVAVDRHITQATIWENIWVEAAAEDRGWLPGRSLVAVLSTQIEVIPASTQGAHEHGQTHTGLKLKNPRESVTTLGTEGAGKRWNQSDKTRTPSIGTRPIGVIS
jgi:hypothetical protein